MAAGIRQSRNAVSCVSEAEGAPYTADGSAKRDRGWPVTPAEGLHACTSPTTTCVVTGVATWAGSPLPPARAATPGDGEGGTPRTRQTAACMRAHVRRRRGGTRGSGFTAASNNVYGHGGGRGGVSIVVMGVLLARTVAVLAAADVRGVRWRWAVQRRRRRRHRCVASTGTGRGSGGGMPSSGSTVTSNSDYGGGGGRNGGSTVVLDLLLMGMMAMLAAAAVDGVGGYRTVQQWRQRH